MAALPGRERNTHAGMPLYLPKDIVAGDFDNNGTLDLAVARSGSNEILIMYNNGAAQFAGQGLLHNSDFFGCNRLRGLYKQFNFISREHSR